MIQVEKNKKMRILMINEVLGVTSTGAICSGLAEYMLARGHEVKVLYGRMAAPKRCESYGVRIASDWEVKGDAMMARLFDNCGLGSHKATDRAIEIIREFSPDVIHLHNLHGYYINYFRLLESIQKMQIPVVWTLHDCWALTGHCAYFDYCGCEKWKTGCEKCPQRKQYPKSLLLDRSSRNYQKKKEIYGRMDRLEIVVPSRWLADIVKESILAKNVRVIPNGVDTNVFRHREGNYFLEKGLTDKKVLLGVASIWEPRKGLQYFAKLANILPDEYQVVLIGLNERQKKELPSGIIGVPRTNGQEELAYAYSSAYAFLNPTKEDNYPTTNMEAICCGTPVITFDTGGSPESAGYYGAVCEKSAEALLKAVRQIRDIDTEGIAKARKAFDGNVMKERYESLYREMIT